MITGPDFYDSTNALNEKLLRIKTELKKVAWNKKNRTLTKLVSYVFKKIQYILNKIIKLKIELKTKTFTIIKF